MRAPVGFSIVLAFAFCANALAAAPDNGFGTTWGNPNKIYRYAFEIAETGFDPAQTSDVYSQIAGESMLEGLLDYDYLARPFKLRPRTAVALPEISADGLVYTFRVKPGILFHDDPAFKGQKRELTAKDYEYSIRRHFDPKNKSVQMYLLETRIKGLADTFKAANKNGKYDYDTPVEGIKVLDKYTLQIHLIEPDYNVLYLFSYYQFAAVAREVVEFYGDDIISHPVGTGPFMLKGDEWKRTSKMVFVANPNYREEYWDGEPAADDTAGQAMAKQMKGKRLPQVGRVEVYVVQERQPRWLAFLNEEHDLFERVPTEYALQLFVNDKPTALVERRGMQLERLNEYSITYSYFQMLDPVVGGDTPEKVALRRALVMAYSNRDEITIVRKGQAVNINQPFPPNALGYDAAMYFESLQEDVAKANALLDAYGYLDRDGDGWRERPDGSPLVLTYASTPTQQDKELDELWKRTGDSVRIKFVFKKSNWPDLLKESKAAKLQMWGLAWQGGHPDAESFLSMLYGPNGGQSNHARFKNTAFDRLYEKAKGLPPGPERYALYREMSRIFATQVPWRLGVNRIQTNVAHPWVRGYRMNPLNRQNWKFIDIDLDRLTRANGNGKRS